MQIKTFRASTLQEALQQVRQSLGPDASVLHTRELRQSRFGLFPKRLVEVEASVDVCVASRFDLPSRVAPSALEASDKSSTQVYGSAATKLPREVEQPARSTSEHDPASAMPNHRVSSLSPAMVDVLTEMLDAGVEPQLAKDLLNEACGQCDDPQREEIWSLQGRISQAVASSIGTCGEVNLADDEQKVMALVGPTGVGKTTTLAKIAAGFRYERNSQIGLITLDTFRLGAVDQLLQYAELISAPLEVVSTPDQVTSALRRLRECDLVLLDTAGRSPKDAEQLAVLADCLHAAQPDEVHLVLSATGSQTHVRETIKQFAAMNPTSLLVTKLDETVAFGEWLGLLLGGGLPVSYVTAGQRVPQDIAVATPRRLASMLLGQSQNMHANSTQEASLK